MTTNRWRVSVGRMLALGFMALALQGCDAKAAEFFGPAIAGGGGGGGGGGGTELTAGDIPGTWTVSYTTTSTSCEASLAPFDVDADFDITGTGSSATLDVLFPDAPVPITGTITFPDGDYMGTTGPVDIGGGLDATESWDVTFSLSMTDVVFLGTSNVDVEDAGTFVCNRSFNLTGVKAIF